MNKQLNNTIKLKNIQDEYFVKMMLPDSEKRAIPYVKEEELALKDLLFSVINTLDYNFIVIGAGTMWYLDLSYDIVKSYIAIEPLADVFIQKQVRFLLEKHNNIKIVGSGFGEFVNEHYWSNNSIFVFHFNILSYIPNPIDKINKYLKEGDILYISSWNSTKKAKAVRKEYFDYLNANSKADSYRINPEDEIGLCNLDVFPFSKLKFYKNHRRIKGEITDILIVYC